MPDLPHLGPRAINAYNRFARELAAFNYVLRHTKASAPVSDPTLMTLNGLINMARRLFRRHPDLPRFTPFNFTGSMTLTDLNIHIARLNAASVHFEECYADLSGTLMRQMRKTH